MSLSNVSAPSPIVQILRGESGVIYREIRGYPGYAVGDDGSVWSSRRCWWRKLKTTPSDSGYCTVSVCRNGKATTKLVHRLVLESFIGPCPDGMEACHSPDRNPSNNRLSNLRWDTHEGNERDVIRDGTASRGSRQHKARFTDDDVLTMMRLLRSGARIRDVARQYGARDSTVSNIYRGRSWGWLTGIKSKKSS